MSSDNFAKNIKYSNGLPYLMAIGKNPDWSLAGQLERCQSSQMGSDIQDMQLHTPGRPIAKTTITDHYIVIFDNGWMISQTNGIDLKSPRNSHSNLSAINFHPKEMVKMTRGAYGSNLNMEQSCHQRKQIQLRQSKSWDQSWAVFDGFQRLFFVPARRKLLNFFSDLRNILQISISNFDFLGMAAKKVDALEERLEGEMNQIKETVEERMSSMEGQVADLRDMMKKMLEFQTQSAASDAKGPEAKNTNSEIHREEEVVEIVEGRRGRPHLEPFQREERGGGYGERQGYGGMEPRGAGWEHREGYYGRRGARCDLTRNQHPKSERNLEKVTVISNNNASPTKLHF
ncbi:hypothetical protein M5K25_027985 [Dendrobium thyrsiflorum]|uniref:Uncharacterized protein n=1 Tax=Dendrobium thyrsiflorum TaxID=117978 RepID=A0ABD0TVI2_DENTH